LARKHSVKEIWTGIHSGTLVPRAHGQHPQLGVQDQQEDRLTDRAHGWSKSTKQNLQALSSKHKNI